MYFLFVFGIPSKSEHVLMAKNWRDEHARVPSLPVARTREVLGIFLIVEEDLECRRCDRTIWDQTRSDSLGRQVDDPRALVTKAAENYNFVVLLSMPSKILYIIACSSDMELLTTRLAPRCTFYHWQ